MSDTTADLITKVKFRGTIPDSGVAYSDDVIVDLMDQTLQGFIIPEMEKINEEFFLVTIDVQMDSQTVVQTGTVPVDVDNVINIPPSAMGMRLRDVQIIGTDGTPFGLTRLTVSQASAQPYSPYALTGWAGMGMNASAVGGFFIQGNQVQLFPYGLARGKLVRLIFLRSINELILTSSSGQVVSKLNDTLTLDKTVSWVVGNKVCVSSQYNPHDFVRDLSVPTPVYASYPVLANIPLVNVVGNVVTLPVGTCKAVEEGDWVALDGQSVFAQTIPKEMLTPLIQKTVCAVLEAAGDVGGLQVAELTYERMIKLAITALSPRVIGKPVKILPLNSPFKAARGLKLGRF